MYVRVSGDRVPKVTAPPALQGSPVMQYLYSVLGIKEKHPRQNLSLPTCHLSTSAMRTARLTLT